MTTTTAIAQPGEKAGPRGYLLSQHRCEVDGLDLWKHCRCLACGILIGPGHLVTALDDAGNCPACARFRHRHPGALVGDYRRVRAQMYGEAKVG